MDQSSKLSSLIIHNHYSQYRFYPFLDTVLQFLPSQINYLEIPFKHVEQIEMIFERCCHLAILHLENNKWKLSKKIQEWFEENTINSIFQRHSTCNRIWIGGKAEEEIFNHKRLKLTD